MRTIQNEDAAILASIHYQSFEDSWSSSYFQQLLKTCFGFINDGGFILCRQACEEIEIITFCVIPNMRNKGIGRSLLHQLELYAYENKIASIFLEVQSDNSTAQHLYKSFNYIPVAIRKNYYGTHDAIVMKRAFYNNESM